jgi:hypothetical protein
VRADGAGPHHRSGWPVCRPEYLLLCAPYFVARRALHVWALVVRVWLSDEGNVWFYAGNEPTVVNMSDRRTHEGDAARPTRPKPGDLPKVLTAVRPSVTDAARLAVWATASVRIRTAVEAGPATKSLAIRLDAAFFF